MKNYQQSTIDACLALVDKGCSTRDVEQLTGVSRQTVSRWVANRETRGDQTLKILETLEDRFTAVDEQLRYLEALILRKDELKKYSERQLTLVNR